MLGFSARDCEEGGSTGRDMLQVKVSVGGDIWTELSDKDGKSLILGTVVVGLG